MNQICCWTFHDTSKLDVTTEFITTRNSWHIKYWLCPLWQVQTRTFPYWIYNFFLQVWTFCKTPANAHAIDAHTHEQRKALRVHVGLKYHPHIGSSLSQNLTLTPYTNAYSCPYGQSQQKGSQPPKEACPQLNNGQKTFNMCLRPWSSPHLHSNF